MNKADGGEPSVAMAIEVIGIPVPEGSPTSRVESDECCSDETLFSVACSLAYTIVLGAALTLLCMGSVALNAKCTGRAEAVIVGVFTGDWRSCAVGVAFSSRGASYNETRTVPNCSPGLVGQTATVYYDWLHPGSPTVRPMDCGAVTYLPYSTAVAFRTAGAALTVISIGIPVAACVLASIAAVCVWAAACVCGRRAARR
jgi:hypothetical protein